MPETNNREVNNDTEVIDADKIPDGDQEGDDETVIDAIDEDAGEATGDEGEETATDDEDSDSSQEDDQGDADDTDNGAVANTDHSQKNKKPAPVPGETSREKALREELVRVRQKNRDLSMGKIVGEDGKKSVSAEDQGSMSDDEVEKLHAMGYDDEEIKNMENAIDILASRKGYVKQSTLQNQNEQTTVNAVLKDFTKEHGEYLPENDPGDVRWDKFYEILKSGVYNIRGKSPEQLARIYKRVNEDVIEELGEPEITVNDKKQAAQNQKITSVSHSGGTKSAPTKKAPSNTKTPALDPAVRGMFKGFDDEDFSA